MTVFLLLATPLAAVTAYLFIGPRFDGSVPTLSDVRTRRVVIRNPVVVASLSFIPLFLVYSLIRDVFPYSPSGLFFDALLREYLGWFFLQSFVSFLLVRRAQNRPEHDQYVIHLVVAAVLLSLLSVAELVTVGPALTVEDVFLRPAARIALLALVPVALTVADNARGGGWAVLLVFVQPIPAAVMAMLFDWFRPGAAILVLLALLGGTGAVLRAMLWRDGGSTSD